MLEKRQKKGLKKVVYECKKVLHLQPLNRDMVFSNVQGNIDELGG
tara:strand:- start:309 stop:443 length:135 start_codon:yes stop_codon:yes gene_type:complete